MTLWMVSDRLLVVRTLGLLVVRTLRLLIVIPILGLLVIRLLVVTEGIVVLLLRLLLLLLVLVLHPESNMALCQHAYNEGSSSKLHLDGIAQLSVCFFASLLVMMMISSSN